jgi:ribosomal protein S18 acetylase RimI-like enzyme
VATIRKATDADVTQLARTYARAFAHDPVIRWFMPDDDEYEAEQLRFFAPIVRRWRFHDTVWCTDDGVAAAGWNPPGRPESEVVDLDPIEHPPWRLERFAALREHMVANTPAEPHWHLNMLGTHPDWQRRGIAGSLMSIVFEIADAEGVPCYLETETTDNVAYYRHHGFEVRSEWDVATNDSRGPHMWGMLRQVS